MTIFNAEHHNDGVECIVFSPDEKTFASMSVPIQEKIATMYICDSETGHCISGPFESKVKNPHCHGGYLDPDGNIFWPSAGNLQWSGTLGGVRSSLNLKPTILPLFVMGRYRGRIASTHWDRDRTGVRVKLRDAGNGVLISNELFKVTGVGTTRLSPNGRFLAIRRRSENPVELWNVEDGKDVQRFPCPSGTPLSLRFSPTSDSLVATFNPPDHICLWRLDTQAMASINLEAGYIPPAVVHLPSTDRLFIPRDDTVEVWEVSVTGSKMISKMDSPMTSRINRICPSRDGRRLLVGCWNGSAMMWSLNAEDMAGDRPVAGNTQYNNRAPANHALER